MSLKYNPPGGKIGARIAKWLGAGLDEEVKEDLRKFKRAMDTREARSSDGRPIGTSG